jgi:hypothetical protein
MEKPEGKRPLGRPTLRWEDSVKMDLSRGGTGGVDWFVLVRIGCCEWGNKPSGSIKCRKCLD